MVKRLFVCILCHFSDDVDWQQSRGPGCPKCRYAMIYLGRESSSLSIQATEAKPKSGRDAVPEQSGIRSKTLWGHSPDPDILELETQLRYRPDDPEILGYLAKRYLALRDWFHAILYLNKLTHLTPNELLYGQLAEAQLHAGHYSDAVDSLIRVLQYDATNPVAHYNMAIALRFMGGASEKIRIHAEAANMFSDDPDLKASARRIGRR